MVHRKILYRIDRWINPTNINTKYCPYCKKDVEFILEDKKYYAIIKCKICRNTWIEGESIQRETT
jgi:hypothetical protein